MEDYDRYMEVVEDLCGANFLMVRFTHIRQLGADAASLLAFLIYRLHLKNGCKADKSQLLKEGFWFRCPAGEIQKHLGLGEGKQRRVITRLEELHLISTQHRTGNTLWVRVECDAVDHLEGSPRQKRRNEVSETPKRSIRNAETKYPETAQPVESDTHTDESAPLNSLSNTPSDTGCPPSSPGAAPTTNGTTTNHRPLKPAVDPVIRKLAARVWKTFEAIGKIFIPPRAGEAFVNRELDKWARQFHDFIPSVMRSRRLDRKQAWKFLYHVVLDHAAHIDEKMQPKAFAANTICKEFTRIVAAMERREQGDSTMSQEATRPPGRWVETDIGGGEFENRWVVDEN